MSIKADGGGSSVTSDIDFEKSQMASARARGRRGGRPYKMTQAKLRLAMALLGQLETKISPLYEELGISKQTLYRHLSPNGELRGDGKKLLGIN